MFFYKQINMSMTIDSKIGLKFRNLINTFLIKYPFLKKEDLTFFIKDNFDQEIFRREKDIDLGKNLKSFGSMKEAIQSLNEEEWK